MRIILLTLVISLSVVTFAQNKKEVSSYFGDVKAVVATETISNNLVDRLDTLKSKFIPSRSLIKEYFNRDIDLGFRHRRILVRLNFASFQIDLLCRNDTIYLSLITTEYYKELRYEEVNKNVTEKFVKARNVLYSSLKTSTDLVNEISLDEQYAFYCGYANSLTKIGKQVNQLVEDESFDNLQVMLASFNCEVQAFGVAGFDMLTKKGYEIKPDIQILINYIKKRNSELVTCSGCVGGIVQTIY